MEQESVRPQRRTLANGLGGRPRSKTPLGPHKGGDSGPEGWAPLPRPPAAPTAPAARGAGIAWEVTLAMVLVAFVVSIAAALFLAELWLADRVMPGVRVWDLDLGGLAREQAQQRLEAGFRYPIDRYPTLRYGELSWTISPADLGIRLDTVATLEAAMAPGHRGDLRTRLREQIEVLANGWMAMPLFAVDSGTGAMYMGRIAQQVNRPARNATLDVGVQQGIKVMPSQRGIEVDEMATLDALTKRVLAMQAGEVQLVVRESEPVLTDLSAAQAAVERILSGPIFLRASGFEPWTIDVQTLVRWLVIQPVVDNDAQPTLSVSLDRNQIAAFAEQIAPQIARDPRNARFRLDVGRNIVVPVVESVPGQSLDITTTVTLVEGAAASGERMVELPVVPIPAAIATADAPDISRFKLIGEGVTNYTGSTAARVNNIIVGTSQFDGVLVRPGETFSFNRYLGEVSAAKGYEESIIIWGNQTKTDVGGGLCQVSSTAFRAAFWAGVPIVERWPHAFRLSYYEPPKGMDATIFTPSVDLRWVNDTGEYILIRTAVDKVKRTVTFRLYGKDRGRTVQMDGPYESRLVKPEPPLLRNDPTLPKGQKKLIESAKDGLDVTIYRIVKENGLEIRRDEFFSRYRPWQAVYLVGTKE